MKLATTSIALLLLATLAGCSSTPYDPTEGAISRSESFRDFNLSGTNHSEAMQVMHLVSRRAVVNENDLDDFANENSNTAIGLTQGLSIGGAIAGAMNPFQLATKLIGLESTKSSMAFQYKENMLISIVPVQDNLNTVELRSIIKQTYSNQIAIAEKAYHKAGLQTKTVHTGGEITWSHLFPKSAVVPMNHDLSKVEFCKNPNTFMDNKDERHDSPLIRECFVVTNPIINLYNDNGVMSDGVLPKSHSFMVIRTTLPDIFPISSIDTSTEYAGIMLYQPSFYWMGSDSLEYYTDDKREEFVKFWNNGMFSYTPKITDLESGEILKFGSK